MFPTPIVTVKKCHYDKCGKEYTVGGRLYCRHQCGVMANRKKAAQRNADASPILNSPYVNRKDRVCLDCNKTFDSEGSWNRICPKCSRRHEGLYVRETTGGHVVTPNNPHRKERV